MRERTEIGRWQGASLWVGLAMVLLFFIGSGLISFLNVRSLGEETQLVGRTHEVLTSLQSVLNLVTDAETAQRGYIISGDDRYLEPYTAGFSRIPEQIEYIERLSVDDPELQEQIPVLKSRVEVRLEQLRSNLELAREDGFAAAQAALSTDQGRVAMNDLRNQIELMREEQQVHREEKVRDRQRAYRTATVSGLVTATLGAVLSVVVALLLRRGALQRTQEGWLQSGQLQLTEVMAGDQRMEPLSENVLRFLAEYLGAQAGAMFVNNGKFERMATYGVAAEDPVPATIENEDGLLWRAICDQRPFILEDVPAGYLSVGSALGNSQPRHLLITPVVEQGQTNAVLELGFLQPINETIKDLFERVSESIGVAIRSVKYRTHLQELLEETQRQSEELQSQSEELRVSNEELEEQGRALRESQARLENQQAEMEQVNAQLEEQTQLLEVQRDEASRARASVEMQARQLAEASRYKSDFLANMSHELRTPLNSSLILAKLLADNPAGNLTAEQVQYAQTIQSAGNDLLALINDILDLSKIEAGHMEMRPAEVSVAELVTDLKHTFEPLASQKGLTFQTEVSSGCPEVMETDRQRLEQVLKNLLSNAIKFTESGTVTLTVSRAAKQQIRFSVSDTGIGIPEDKQELVFEAFRQVEGTSSRKYGGTGLGLSISRQLSQLLGGELHLESTAGEGSVFTVTIPVEFDEAAARQQTKTTIRRDVAANEAVPALQSSAANEERTPRPRKVSIARRVTDDRERLTGSGRVILVVEDDVKFARIIYDLAHELDFQCLIATTAEEGLAMAVQYLPSAMVLDVGLPDNSGLSVLDRLKQDRRTRHIPIHVVSASDYQQTALSLGAVGYLLKPVKREDLGEALRQLETRFVQRMRRVLIVEDDLVQLDSLQRLLGAGDVETVGAASAAECLERLKVDTFDCMVLDLTLPDASGFTLLETLSREDAYAFPPAIVYTGRDLSTDEEQRLRRYSKSIIIKGAKSPERLLDEVTLFLHQIVSELPAEQQQMLERARSRDAAIEGRRILIVEDDVRNVFALTSILEPKGAVLQIARNGREALQVLEDCQADSSRRIDLVLMDVMMPEMDGITAVREIRKRPEWKRLAVIMLTAKAMKDDQENCLTAGANDYMAKPLDVEKLLSLVRVWMPR